MNRGDAFCRAMIGLNVLIVIAGIVISTSNGYAIRSVQDEIKLFRQFNTQEQAEISGRIKAMESWVDSHIGATKEIQQKVEALGKKE
jgi:hypothetical protein